MQLANYKMLLHLHSNYETKIIYNNNNSIDQYIMLLTVVIKIGSKSRVYDVYLVYIYLASSPSPLGEGRKGPGTHRLRMCWLYHAVAIIFRSFCPRNLHVCCIYFDRPQCAVESAREKPHCRRQDRA